RDRAGGAQRAQALSGSAYCGLPPRLSRRPGRGGRGRDQCGTPGHSLGRHGGSARADVLAGVAQPPHQCRPDQDGGRPVRLPVRTQEPGAAVDAVGRAGMALSRRARATPAARTLPHHQPARPLPAAHRERTALDLHLARSRMKHLRPLIAALACLPLWFASAAIAEVTGALAAVTSSTDGPACAASHVPRLLARGFNLTGWLDNVPARMPDMAVLGRLHGRGVTDVRVPGTGRGLTAAVNAAAPGG